MRKRVAAYATTAILVGVAIMALPLTMQQPSIGRLTPMYTASSGRANASSEGSLPISGLVRQPINFVPLSGILLTGLIVALGVYLVLRSQTR